MNKKNLEVLQFIYDRLECVYEENPRYDYMTKFNKIIQAEQLILSGVSQQRELLIAFAKYMEEDKMYARHDEANVDDFLENYSD
jgi:hypothetical protein